MIYDIRQETSYHYGSPVAHARHVLRLSLVDGPDQRVFASTLDVVPTPVQRREGQDFFGNKVTWIALDQPHDALTVRVAARVAVDRPAPMTPATTPAWENVRADAFAIADLSPRSPAHFLFPSRLVSLDPEIRDYAATSFLPDRACLEGAMDLMHRIKSEFVYEVGATTATTTPPMSFALRRGVCQDFSHIMISGLRSLGSAGGLRQRLSADVDVARGDETCRRRCDARLGAGLVRCGDGLDRPRSDQQHGRGQRPRGARGRPGLRGRRADGRRYSGVGRAATGGVRRGDACPCRKSNPCVLMRQTAENGSCLNASYCLHGAAAHTVAGPVEVRPGT